MARPPRPPHRGGKADAKLQRPKFHTVLRRERRNNELQEIEALEARIEAGKPDSGTNPLAAVLPATDPAAGGHMNLAPYVGAKMFDQLPLSERTKKGLGDAKYSRMTAIQRASLPHALCGRDVLGAAKTGSGKTLAFLIPVHFYVYMGGSEIEDCEHGDWTTHGRVSVNCAFHHVIACAHKVHLIGESVGRSMKHISSKEAILQISDETIQMMRLEI